MGKKVKPLQLIWSKYPNLWSSQNTVHVDDIEKNFLLNKASGILISPFVRCPLPPHVQQQQLQSYCLRHGINPAALLPPAGPATAPSAASGTAADQTQTQVDSGGEAEALHPNPNTGPSPNPNQNPSPNPQPAQLQCAVGCGSAIWKSSNSISSLAAPRSDSQPNLVSNPNPNLDPPANNGSDKPKHSVGDRQLLILSRYDPPLIIIPS